MLAANLVTDLDAWLFLLVLHDQDELADAEPDTVLDLPPARPARSHARRRHLHLAPNWPWAATFRSGLATPDRPDRRHLTNRPRLDEDQEGEPRVTPGPWNPAQPQRQAKTLTAHSGDKEGEVITLCGDDHR
ncbi:hypothetical protein [Streptomyces sp. NPDC017260]|uniref:hypothetical protein n=1 Tax=unclassified Streptomyces TaxID=2593676 RepID=UPI0037B2949C